MKKVGLFVVIALLMSACGQFGVILPAGPMVSEYRDVERFERISVSAGINLVVCTGEQHVSVEANENIISYVETYVKKNTLIIRPMKHVLFGHNADVVVYVDIENICAIEASGGAEVMISSILTTDNLSVSVSGGGSLECDDNGIIDCGQLSVDLSGGSKASLLLVCDRLLTDVSGGGNIFLAGTVTTADINLSGGSRLKAYQMETTEMDVVMSGGGYAEVYVTDYLYANLSGGSKMRYKGSPRIKTSLSGGSEALPVE